MENGLQVHWLYLAFALLMLWYPRHLLRLGQWRSKKRRHREALEKFAQDGANDPDDKSVKLRRELAKPRNHLDYLRGFAGAAALWSFSFTAVGPDAHTAMFWLCVAASTVAFIIQTTRFRARITFFAAIFFAVGLSIGMGNYFSGAMAFLLTCAINPVIPTPRMFLTIYALLLLPFNWLLGGGGELALVNSGILLLPPLLSLLAKRPMVIFTRKRNLTW